MDGLYCSGDGFTLEQSEPILDSVNNNYTIRTILHHDLSSLLRDGSCAAFQWPSFTTQPANALRSFAELQADSQRCFRQPGVMTIPAALLQPALGTQDVCRIWPFRLYTDVEQSRSS